MYNLITQFENAKKTKKKKLNTSLAGSIYYEVKMEHFQDSQDVLLTDSDENCVFNIVAFFW